MQMIEIEVVCAFAGRQELRRLQVARGATVAQAVAACCLAELFTELDLTLLATGIFGRVVTGEYVLEADDRLELYRPLSADPKLQRRRRAQGEPRKR